MAMIQAITRKKKYEINIVALGVALAFLPNDKGDVVCDVAGSDAQDWLLSIPAAFRLYGEPDVEPISTLLTAPQVAELPPVPDSQVAELPVDGHRYMLKNGETEFDLRPLTDDELHAFAQANGIKVSSKAKGDAIRDKIVQALTAEV